MISAISLRRVAALCVAAPLLWAPAAFAQTGPSGIDRAIVTATAPLSSKQQADLEAFASTWADLLANPKNPRSLDDARRTLTEPLRDPAATLVFRRAVAQALLPKLEPIIDGVDLQRAIHAIQVVRFLRTPEAVEALAGRLGADKNADVGKRLVIASTLVQMLEDADLNPVQCDGIARTITAAALKETSGMVMGGEIRALSSIARRPNLAASSVELARLSQASILQSLVSSIGAKTDADPRMQSVPDLIVHLRGEYLAQGGPVQTKFGVALAPALVDVLAAASKQWESARKDAQLIQAYANAVAYAETLLRVIDPKVRSNQTPPTAEKAIANAWDSDNHQAFDAEVAKWKTVVGQAPYR